MMASTTTPLGLLTYALALALAIALSSTARAAPYGGGSRPKPNYARANAVKRAFETSWNGYHEQAFPHDTLRPVSGTFEDDRNGWGVTVVDALSTAIIMGEGRMINQMLDHIAGINFTLRRRSGPTTASPFSRATSGYDLLRGPMRPLVGDASKVDALLAQAVRLADSLSVAFDTPSGIPDPTVFLRPTRRHSGTSSNNIAEVGTLVLEWTRLSDLSGEPRYAALAQKAESYLLRPTGSPEAWPGLVGGDVSTRDGTFLNSNGGWSGGTDSFYEYLIKMYQYDPRAFAFYKERWVLAAESTMAHLASHPTGRPDLTYLSQFAGQQTDPVSTHLASFAGGNFILGGVLLGNDTFVQFGLALARSYFNNYLHTPAGIGPEVFRWVDAALPADASRNEPPPASQKDFYARAGFYTTAGAYILRPETVESIYYAYRLTGDPTWQDMAWQAFQSITAVCGTGSAYAQLNDVMKPDGGGFIDQMQSFWMAETLKYLYLIFAPESDVQLQLQGAGTSQFVFNTEAHPIRVREEGPRYDEYL
ncbi:hypothetical protein RJ55_08530 [Drechmeria coniospora]|nr:hypothetical protein RJ55_08530 [Drechmeria coniospora]